MTPENANGQEVASYAGTVLFTSSDKWVQLPVAASPFTSGTATLAPFSVTPGVAGSLTLTAKDIDNATVTGSATVTVR